MELRLVGFYDIQPGNGAGPLFQPQSPHVASDGQMHVNYYDWISRYKSSTDMQI